MPKRLLITLLLLTTTVQACRAYSLPFRAAVTSPGDVLFQDDFSDPLSGWDRLSNSASGVLDYAEGMYRITVNTPYTLLWATPNLIFGDVRVEVNTLKAAGPANDNFGVVCRAADKDNFYFFVISSDGYYGIGKTQDGVPQLIGMKLMPPSEEILQGKAINHLRADCVGESFSLYVNDVFLARAQDSDFPSGKVGLTAGTFAEGGTEVYFDNFKVLEP